ncbi:Histone acetyltransferase GCN5 [Diplonema papillatum]|nr:Histone acetyltransferase GCN5 [Diplonema papillatum]
MSDPAPKRRRADNAKAVPAGDLDKEAAKRKKGSKADYEGVLHDLWKLDEHAVFHYPVTGVEGYNEAIKDPIDLTAMKKKVENEQYPSDEAFESDFVLMFSNCMSFNPEGSFWFAEAVRLHKALVAKVFPKYGMVADIYVPYERATDDATTLLQAEQEELNEFGGEEGLQRAREQELEEMKRDSKRPLKDLLADFGDPEAILKASAELTQNHRKGKGNMSNGDGAESDDEDEGTSSSSSGSDDDDDDGSTES